MRPTELFDPNNSIDVTKVSIETPETVTEPWFDPERDLTPEHWEIMEKELEFERTNTGAHHWYDFSKVAKDIHTVDPRRDLHINDTELNGMMAYFNSRRNEGKQLITMAAQLRAIAPEQDLHISPEEKTAMLKTINFYRTDPQAQWDMFLELAADFHVFYPEIDLKLGATEQKGMLGALQNEREREKKLPMELYYIANTAARIHSLVPELQLLTPEEEAAMRAALSNPNFFPGGYKVSEMIANMCILNQQPTVKTHPDQQHPLPQTKTF